MNYFKLFLFSLIVFVFNNYAFAADAAKGTAIVAQIMVLLSEICLGVHYFEVALILREAFLITNDCAHSLPPPPVQGMSTGTQASSERQAQG